MTIDQLEATVAALQTRHRMDIEATREGENPPELDQVDRYLHYAHSLNNKLPLQWYT